LGFNIAIKSELLAEALRLLPERQRDIVMGYYFLGMSDRAIGEESNARRSTVGYQRNIALKKLKEILEGLQHEEN
jgi:RNA polymerase sigma factor (sigma-70 family)